MKANPDGTLHAGYGGVSTCGSVWSCSQCAAVIATRRADELADVMRAVDALGGSAFLLTLTMRHSAGDRLGWNREQRREWAGLETRRRDRDIAREIGAEVDEDQAREDAERREVLERARGCWDALSHGWGRVTSGKAWTKDQDRLGGLLGWVKVVETTRGANGWHCHIHALICVGDDVPLEDARPVAERAFRRWQSALADRGFDTSGDMAADGKVPGWDLRRAQLGESDLASYFTKLSHEITGAHHKVARRPGGVTPFALASIASETYRDTDVARWHEWQRASEGRRQITWSTGQRDLRKLAELGPEQSDEEIAAETVEADERVGLAADVFGWLRATENVTTLLDVGEAEDVAGIVRWLDERGLSYTRGMGLGWEERPPREPDVPIDMWDGSPGGLRIGEYDVGEGLGRGWELNRPAVLRPTDSMGRKLRRSSDRPPRWTDDARMVVRTDRGTPGVGTSGGAQPRNT